MLNYFLLTNILTSYYFYAAKFNSSKDFDNFFNSESNIQNVQR